MTRRTRPRRIAVGAGAVLVAAVLGAVACGKTAGETALCSCDYVTDTDLPGKQSVVICAAADPPEGLAAACVRDLGVGHVEACTCAREGEPCTMGLCRQP